MHCAYWSLHEYIVGLAQKRWWWCQVYLVILLQESSWFVGWSHFVKDLLHLFGWRIWFARFRIVFLVFWMVYWAFVCIWYIPLRFWYLGKSIWFLVWLICYLVYLVFGLGYIWNLELCIWLLPLLGVGADFYWLNLSRFQIKDFLLRHHCL